MLGQRDVANYKQALRVLVVVIRRRKMRIEWNTKTTTTHAFLCMRRQKHVSGYSFNICVYKHLNLKENTRSWNLRDGAIDRTLSKPRFGKGYGSVARKICKERMKFVQYNDEKMFYNSTSIYLTDRRLKVTNY